MTDKVRKTVSFPEDLETQISKRARKFDRSFSAQVVADMRTIVSSKIPARDLVIEDRFSQRWEIADDEE